ncbi:hypothetical protein GF323_04700 [Candidatus Woesearchaeota archaeon]|nr:hypothetical protein [Candidatus Woesearchaeota archaeon]
MDIQKTEQLFKDIKNLEQKYRLSYKEILDLAEKKNIGIPLSIFNKKLGSLESIVKYLKENLKLSIREIAFLTARKEQPIRTTYNRARKKLVPELKARGKALPLSIIENKSLSVLESIVAHLLSYNYTLNQVSSILKRDYKTVWTIRQRINNKT